MSELVLFGLGSVVTVVVVMAAYWFGKLAGTAQATREWADYQIRGIKPKWWPR